MRFEKQGLVPWFFQPPLILVSTSSSCVYVIISWLVSLHYTLYINKVVAKVASTLTKKTPGLDT